MYIKKDNFSYNLQYLTKLNQTYQFKYAKYASISENEGVEWLVVVIMTLYTYNFYNQFTN